MSAARTVSAWRSQWAGVLASAVVAVVGGGGLLTSDAAGVESSFVAVTPTRVLDTRIDVGLVGPFVSEQARVLTVTGSVPTTSGTATVVPSGATAIVMNVTVVNPSAAGYFSVRPGDAVGAPGTSNLNFNSGVVVPNAVTVELPPAGNLNLFYFGNGPAGATTHLLIDVVGYFVAGGAGPAGDAGIDGEDAVLGPDQGRVVPFNTNPDATGNVGIAPSIAIGVDGLPIIAHSDGANSLRVTHCENMSCTAVTTTAFAVGSGSTPSIAIGSDGLPIIAHQDQAAAAFDLRVTHCDNVACTSASTVTVESDSDTGWDPAIAIGADGLPIIVHHSGFLDLLRVTHCNNVACTSDTTSTIDTVDYEDGQVSIAIGTDGLAIIAHQEEASALDLVVSHCVDTACTSATHTPIDTANDVGNEPSIAIGTDGLPSIAHYDNTTDDLRITHCNNVACTSATHRTIDATNNVGNRPSITIGLDGFPVIAHRDGTNDELRLSYCVDLVCSSATSIVLDSVGNIANDPSITIGSDSHIVIAHRDASLSDLRFSKVQHMSWTLNGWES